MKERFKNIGRGLGYFGIYVASQIAGSMACSIGFGIYVGVKAAKEGKVTSGVAVERATELLQNNMGIVVITSAILALLTLAIMYKVRHEKMSEKINLKPVSAKSVVAGAGIGTAMYILVVGVLMNLPLSESMINSYADSATGLFTQSAILAIIGNVFAAPIIEEVIFRGLLFDRLKKAMPVGFAMVLSSATFGLMHGQIIWVCYATVVGLFLAYIYHKTGSILPTIAAHMFLNGTSTLVNYTKLSNFATERFFNTALFLAVPVVILLMIFAFRNGRQVAEVKVVEVIYKSTKRI